MFNKEICVVVQGPLDYPEKVVEMYKSFSSNVIVSTNTNSPYITHLIESNGLKLIINDLVPEGRKNFNNQVNNTYKGILKAKELGFKYVLKIRADLFTDDLEKLINSFDLNKIYFPAYHNHDGGYLCEHFIFGDINFMLDLWNIPISHLNIAPEIQLTSKFYQIRTNQKIDYIFPIIFEKNIKIYWEKYKFYLNNYITDKLFTYEDR